MMVTNNASGGFLFSSDNEKQKGIGLFWYQFENEKNA